MLARGIPAEGRGVSLGAEGEGRCMKANGIPVVGRDLLAGSVL